MGKYAKYRSLVALALVLVALAPPPAGAECRQALAMGLDVSGSVDSHEYRLQLDGLAAALMHPDVVDVLLAMPAAPVRLAIYEWSGPQDQRLIQPWVEIDNATTLEAVAARLVATRRSPAGPSTALGIGLKFGAALLAQQQQCWKRTLDISGDGRSNTGPRPQDVIGFSLFEAITVNALVIGQGGEDRGDLSAYFKSRVIHGPDAFVEQADRFGDYEQAMVRKLLRELQGMALSELVLP